MPKSAAEVLNRKFGREKSALLMNRVKNAYHNGARGEKLTGIVDGAKVEFETPQTPLHSMCSNVLFAYSE